jgi:thioredoxin-related protein
MVMSISWHNLDEGAKAIVSEDNTLWLMANKVENQYCKTWKYEIVLRKDNAWYFSNFFAIDNYKDLVNDHFTYG